jgi:hypothetical protein
VEKCIRWCIQKGKKNNGLPAPAGPRLATDRSEPVGNGGQPHNDMTY